MFPKRERQTRWKTSDGRWFDDRDTATFEQKVIELGEMLRKHIRLSSSPESPSVDWCEEVARSILCDLQNPLIIALSGLDKKGAG